MNTFYERIQVLAKYYSIKKTEIISNCDIPYSTYNSLNSRCISPSIETLEKVIKRYPEISFEWLATGKGNMLISKNESKNDPEITALKRQVEILSNRLIEKERYILELELKIATLVE